MIRPSTFFVVAFFFGFAFCGRPAATEGTKRRDLSMLLQHGIGFASLLYQ